MDRFSVYVPKLLPKAENFLSGRRSCKGCAKALAARLASKAVGSSVLPQAAPLIDSINTQGYTYNNVTSDNMLENFLALVDNINASAAQRTKSNHKLIKKPVIAVDRRIFISDYLALTRTLQNPQKALYLCFDNEPYMDDLIRKTAPKPFEQNGLVHPVSEKDILGIIREKSIPAVVNQEKFTYVATACPSFPFDLIEKVKSALDCSGNAFISVLTPCPTGWIFPSGLSQQVGLKAVRTGYFPLYEIQEGSLRITERLKKRPPVQTYLMLQKRFLTLPHELFPAFQNAVDKVYDDLSRREKQV